MKGDMVMQRASALTIPCPHCGAASGDKCFDPQTGYVLENQPAHVRRLQEVHVL